MEPVAIEAQEVVNNLVNKLALAQLQIAQLEVALQTAQALAGEGDGEGGTNG